MKKIMCALALAACVFISSCAGDHQKAIIGTWDAGKASRESRIIVTIKKEGLLTASLTNTEIKPIKGTYAINRENIIIKLSNTTLSYAIVTLDEDKLVMESDAARITWVRLK